MPTLPAFDPVAFLIGCKFPLYGKLSLHHYGDDTGLPLEERKRQLKDINAYKKNLLALSPEELKALVQTEREKQAHDRDAKRPFNRPSSAEDIAHCGALPLWHLEEAIALSLGMEPQRANWKKIAPLLGVSPVAKKYSRLRERVLRAEQAGELSNPISPHTYIEWAQRNMIEVPKELVENVVARSGRILDYNSVCDANAQLTQRVRELETADATREKPLKTKERDSLLKLVIGMATAFYGYNPDELRSKCAGEVASELERVGISLNADTIRKYLKEGAEFLPPAGTT